MRHLIFAVLGCFLAAGASYADSTSGLFDIFDGSPMFSGGEVFFTLNSDGTITAALYSSAGNIENFGFASPGSSPLAESGFMSVTPSSEIGLTDQYNTQGSGFECPTTLTGCGISEMWTIGTPGEFTSVFQALNGVSKSYDTNYDFVMETAPGDWWAAKIQGEAIIPEPSSALPIGVALLGLGMVIRRKRNV
jgi:hypothetical protein